MALIAVASGREVGVDLERVGRRRSAARRPRSYYEAWVRREAAAKCFGGGLGEPPPGRPLVLLPLDAGAGWVAALAVAGTTEPLVRRYGLTRPPVSPTKARQAGFGFSRMPSLRRKKPVESQKLQEPATSFQVNQ